MSELSNVKKANKGTVSEKTLGYQINLNKRTVAAVGLMKTIETDLFNTKHNSFIALVQEPPLSYDEKRIIGFAAGNNLIYEQSGTKPRAAIYISKNINFWTMPEYTNDDMATCMIKLQNKSIILTSVYMDITNKEVWPEHFKKLITYARRRHIGIIIGTDSNAHSTLWGSPVNNARGDKLEDLIYSENLAICNNGNKPTFYNRIAQTHVDLTMTSANYQELITEWHVDTSFCDSDH